MKKYFTCAIIFSFSIASCQTLEGTYCFGHNVASSSNCLTFQENERFSFKNIGHIGINEYGKGKYFIEDKKLTLKFDNIKKQYPNKFVAQSMTPCDTSNMVQLNFKFVDPYGIPVGGVRVKKVNDTTFKSPQSNLEGKLQFAVERKEDKVQFRAYYPLYEIFPFELVLNCNKDILIELIVPRGQLISNKTWTYDIKEIRKDHFVVESGDGPVIFKKNIQN